MASFGRWQARRRIRAAIVKSGKTQAQWAARLGVSEQVLCMQLTCSKCSPTPAVAAAFGMQRLRTKTGAYRYVLQSSTVQ